MATCSSVLNQTISRTEEPGRPQSMGSQQLDTAEQLSTHLSLTADYVKTPRVFIYPFHCERSFLVLLFLFGLPAINIWF